MTGGKYTFQHDRYGVPILSNTEIESLTEVFLRHFHPECLEKPSLTPLASIASTLADRKHVRFEFNRNLGSTDGKRTFGQIDFREKVICIDVRIDANGPIFLFTLAHEIAHFALHRKAPLRLPDQTSSGEHVDDRTTVFALHRAPGSPRDHLERRANRFAAALLMPGKTVREFVEEVQKELGLSDARRGYIFLDSQGTNLRDYHTLVDRMKKQYQTSFTASKIRLRELGILWEVPGSNHIGSTLRLLGISDD